MSDETNDTQDIVTQLRDMACCWRGSDPIAIELRQSADEIERLRSDGDQLRYERDEARKTICWDACIRAGQPTIDAAKLAASARKWNCFGETK